MRARPTPKQARMLRFMADHPELVVRLWFGQVAWMPVTGGLSYSQSYAPDERFKDQLIRTCRRLGWLEAVDRPTYAKLSHGGDEVYLQISQEGRNALSELQPHHFVSVAKPTVRGEAAVILRALAVRHAGSEWVFIPEAPTWVAGRGEVHVDAIALDCWRTKGFLCVGYEIKVSRSDFLGEMRHPDKTRDSATFCHEFYFAVPAGLVSKSEVPDPYGLVAVSDKGTTRMVKRAKKAEPVPTWGLLARLMRRIADENGSEDD